MLSPQVGGWLRFAGRRVLLLQGPHGPFFSRVARALLEAGARTVEKINFNGGDILYYPGQASTYSGALSDWPVFLDAYLKQNEIDCIFMFGDCRPMHRAASTVAQARGLQCWVFEEGYIRPNFITFEQHGVNANSSLPAHRDAYDAWQHADLPDEVPVPPSFRFAAKHAMGYFMASALAWPWFWRYQHHRNLTLLDGLYWIRSYLRKKHYLHAEKNALRDIQPIGARQYFLVVLQVASDAQVAVHSPYETISDFIVDTVRSFAQHAPKDAVLLVKHHPLDRGYSDYSQLIDQLLHAHGLKDRLRYIHDQHLPTLLKHALGVVTINSTVGLSALFHGTPVVTMGKAVYNMQGLTCQDGLEAFWVNPQAYRPDALLHAKFRNYVTTHTQINGNFYVELPGSDAAGLRWRALPVRMVAAAK
jgi:capsular polysaccharide export protein